MLPCAFLAVNPLDMMIYIFYDMIITDTPDPIGLNEYIIRFLGRHLPSIVMFGSVHSVGVD